MTNYYGNMVDLGLVKCEMQNLKVHLRCPICTRVVRAAILQCPRCKNYACGQCIKERFTKPITGCPVSMDKKCPNLDFHSFEPVHNEILLNLLDQIHISCPAAYNAQISDRCPQVETLRYSNYLGHIYNCQYLLRTCPNESCGSKVQNLKQHEKECGSVKMQCQICKLTMTRKDYNSHKLTCGESKMLRCSGCSNEIQLKDLQNHERQCDFVRIECKTCGTSVRRGDFPDHNSQLCTILGRLNKMQADMTRLSVIKDNDLQSQTDIKKYIEETLPEEVNKSSQLQQKRIIEEIVRQSQYTNREVLNFGREVEKFEKAQGSLIKEISDMRHDFLKELNQIMQQHKMSIIELQEQHEQEKYLLREDHQRQVHFIRDELSQINETLGKHEKNIVVIRSDVTELKETERVLQKDVQHLARESQTNFRKYQPMTNSNNHDSNKSIMYNSLNVPLQNEGQPPSDLKDTGSTMPPNSPQPSQEFSQKLRELDALRAQLDDLQTMAVEQANSQCKKAGLWNNWDNLEKCAGGHEDKQGKYHPTFGLGACYACSPIMLKYKDKIAKCKQDVVDMQKLFLQ